MKVKLKSEIHHTDYFLGEKKEIEGKELEVMGIAVDKSAYLCLSDKGLVNVDIRDVEIK